MSDEPKNRTEIPADANATMRLIKRSAHVFTLLFMLCFPFSLGFVGWLLGWGAPLSNVLGSPFILAIVALNLTLISLATYFWLYEKESPARDLWKTGSLAGKWVHGFLLLLMIVILLIIALSIVAMVMHKTFQIGPFDIG